MLQNSPSVVVPGVSRTKSVKSRPFNGSDSMLCCPTTVLSDDCAGSTSGGAAMTVTSLSTLPKVICGRMLAVVPTLTTTSLHNRLPNADFTMDPSYGPGTQYRNTKCPSASLVFVSDMPVARFRAVTVAPGRTALLGSSTVPSRRPLPRADCAAICTGNKIVTNAQIVITHNNDIDIGLTLACKLFIRGLLLLGPARVNEMLPKR